MFLFISGGEIFIILVIVVMLFGADKIPEMARGLGKGMQQLKNATNEVKREITESGKNHGIDTSFVKDIKKEVNKFKDDITKNVDTSFVKDIKKEANKFKDDITENVDDITGPIKRNL